MFHKAVKLEYLDGTMLELSFQDGNIKRYDVSDLFPKYPMLRQLENRELFLSGKLMGGYGIIWNEDLDLEAETVYEDGETVRIEKAVNSGAAARAVAYARSLSGFSQKELSNRTGIDQSDISKIERGLANPSVATLERIAAALGGELVIDIKMRADGDNDSQNLG